MSIMIMSRMFRLSLGGCNRKLVAIRLADFADDDGRGMWPSIGRLSTETELSERTVQRVLKEFVAEGLLVVVREASGRPGQATQYDFDLGVLRRLEERKSTGDSVSPVEGVTGATETGDTDDRDGCHPVTRTVIEPPREPSEREGVRESVKAQKKDLEARHDALRIGKHGNPWPNVLNTSKDWSFRQFQALTSEERDLAEERRDAYLAACPKVKSGDRKGEPDAVPLGVYLRDKLFVDVAAIAPSFVRRAESLAAHPPIIEVAPFGPVWAGLRMLALMEPSTTVLPLDVRDRIQASFDTLRKVSEDRALAYLHRKGVVLDGGKLLFPEGFEEAEFCRRSIEEGYPEANRLNGLAAERSVGRAPYWAGVFTSLCEAVPVGSDMWNRWKRWHAENGKPFVPQGTKDIVWFPKGGPEGLADFKNAALTAKTMERGNEHAL